MPRPRAVQHCRECGYYIHAEITRRSYCMLFPGIHWIRYDDTRTSPGWCPKGHGIPGRMYPSFQAGKDPRIGEDPSFRKSEREMPGTHPKRRYRKIRKR